MQGKGRPIATYSPISAPWRGFKASRAIPTALNPLSWLCEPHSAKFSTPSISGSAFRLEEGEKQNGDKQNGEQNGDTNPFNFSALAITVRLGASGGSRDEARMRRHNAIYCNKYVCVTVFCVCSNPSFSHLEVKPIVESISSSRTALIFIVSLRSIPTDRRLECPLNANVRKLYTLRTNPHAMTPKSLRAAARLLCGDTNAFNFWRLLSPFGSAPPAREAPSANTQSQTPILRKIRLCHNFPVCTHPRRDRSRTASPGRRRRFPPFSKTVTQTLFISRRSCY